MRQTDKRKTARMKHRVQAHHTAPAIAPLTRQSIQRARADPVQLTPNDLLALQRSVGNQAVSRLLGRQSNDSPPAQPAPVTQPLLNVGPADDPYEREAERIARSVVDSPFQPNNIQRQEERGSATKPSAAQPSIGPEGGTVGEDIANRLRRTQHAGTSLPQTVRRALEPKLGVDLGPVKVHTGPQAVQLTRDLQARAFTHKNHIYYGDGQSPHDLRLTAHEAVHTIQQGAVKPYSRAAQAGVDSTAPMSPSTISRMPAQIQREWWWQKRKRRKHQMLDKDVKTHTQGEGGTYNRVDKIRYKGKIGKSKAKLGFFKPDVDISETGSHMSDRAVASSRLDKWLGLNTLAEEVYAQHGQEFGSVSALVKGKPITENQFNEPAPEIWQDLYEEEGESPDPARFKVVDGQLMALSGSYHNYHNFSNPVTQKGLSDLQLLDAITGQADRHGGNIYIDPKTGKVKGIDNDMAFSKGESDPFNSYLGLPALVDEKTANRILKKKSKNIAKALRSKHGGLTNQEIQDLQKRFEDVQDYLRKLKKEKKLVKKWDQTTFTRLMMQDDVMDKFGNATLEPNYTKRSVRHYQQAQERDESDDDNMLMDMIVNENPLYESEEEL